ncbi:protein unc-79 homolog [Watersipora subatra]|uniref:protein unc-79 homolog n=1 Tax=Watersipora subatra TaxID=2589382 RepID=UPI00355C3008
MLLRSRRDEVMPEFGSESAKIIKMLWRSMENEKLEHSILHLLMSLIIKYMSSPTTNEAEDDPNPSQASTIEHIFYLLGYAEGRFFVKPSQLRASPTLNALLTNLPTFLDGNVELATKFLPDFLNILKCCGSPQKYASDNQTPDYTLVHLPPSLTKFWVQSFLIVLYKYNYSCSAELSPTISYLVRIILNTLATIPHSCKYKASDGDSIREVQGVVQAMDQEQTSRKSDEQSGSQGLNLERLGPSSSLPGAPGLLIASSIIHEEDESESLARSRESTLDQTDTSVKASRARSITGSSKANLSPAIAKKSLVADPEKPSKKTAKVKRQLNTDTLSPSKGKLPHWQAIDIPKSDDFASLLENPQSAPPTATAAVEYLSEKPSFKVESSSGASRGSKSASSSDVNIELKKSGDFMARSKRGHAYVPKQDSAESADGKHPGLTPSDSVRRTQCPECYLPVDSYTEETLVLCIVAVETYLNHDLQQAAGVVYDMIRSISRIANSLLYTWQSPDRQVFIPGNVVSSSLQFLRCTLHQLHNNGIMAALLTSACDSHMFKTIVIALTEFPELSSQQALLTALERINEKSVIKNVLGLTENLNTYLSAMTIDLSTCPEWPKIVDQLEILFRKLASHLPEQPCDLSELLTLMSTIFKLPIVTTHKGDRLVETYGKLISTALQTHTFNLIQLAKLCQLGKSTFGKERDKTILARMVVSELMQVLKYKSTLPEANVLILLEIVCMDCGSTLLPTYITNEIPSQLTSDMLIDAGIADVMKLCLNDAIEFICDLHTLLKLRAHMKVTCLHEDTFGGVLKTGVAQILALEMSTLLRNDSKATHRVIPWLYNQPSTIQRGLTHHAVAENVLRVKCQPLSLDDVASISAIVMSIMTGFVEYNPTSVECMSSLNYAFIFCQVWTIYCETLTMEGIEREPEEQTDIKQIIYYFWSKVTPTILNMMQHNRVLPANILVRLRALENHKPPRKRKFNKAILFDWIKKVQFKLAQIEVQSSTAVQFLGI